MKKSTPYLIVIVALLLLNCGSTKTSKDTKKQTSEKGTVETKRKADTVSYTILKPIYKDTTIVVENKENKSTLFVKYDSKGKQDISYVCDEISELRNYIKNIEESTSEKSKVKESWFKPIFILYFFLGALFLITANRVLKRFGI